MKDSRKAILFEPWNLGDALIAVATACQDPERLAVACNSRWHPLIRSALPASCSLLELIPVDLDYINRGRKSRFSLGKLPVIQDRRRVLSIRGDIRDHVAARRIFPQATVRMAGYFPFLARRFAILDAPFRMEWLQIRNRYQAWARLAGVEFTQLEQFYLKRRGQWSAGQVENRKVVIHLGMQWRSRQFPHILQLKSRLEREKWRVELVAGPKDSLPTGISENDVMRRIDQSLIDAFLDSECVIANDSGPMHLAAFLGCRTVVLTRVSNIREWLPPGVVAVCGAPSPKGYQPDAAYCSDTILSGWPTDERIFQDLTYSERL